MITNTPILLPPITTMESQADLEQKIAQYTVQLGQVEELLQLDASNAQFLQLKTDLQNVISLTKALLMQVIGGAHIVPVSSSSANNSSDNAPAPSMPVVRKGAIQVGEVVEVSGGDRLFAGVVTSIINETEYKIKYFEYPDEVSLPSNNLQRIPFTFYSKEQVSVGMSCQCKYALDQNYYDCKVASLTEHGCVVTYTAYGNSEEVPIAYLKPTQSATGAQKPVTGGKNSMKPAAGGLIPIPESLTILPTDTEKEIEKKRKELKSIKNKNRIIGQEAEMQEAQQSWKKFVTKGVKRVDSGIVKSSQFSSPAEVAGKVGVVNSGKTMTDFVARKKHKFDTF